MYKRINEETSLETSRTNGNLHVSLKRVRCGTIKMIETFSSAYSHAIRWTRSSYVICVLRIHCPGVWIYSVGKKKSNTIFQSIIRRPTPRCSTAMCLSQANLRRCELIGRHFINPVMCTVRCVCYIRFAMFERRMAWVSHDIVRWMTKTRVCRYLCMHSVCCGKRFFGAIGHSVWVCMCVHSWDDHQPTGWIGATEYGPIHIAIIVITSRWHEVLSAFTYFSNWIYDQ